MAEENYLQVVAFVGSGKTSAIEKFFSKQMNTKSIFLGSGKSGAPWYRKLIFNIMGSKPKLKTHKAVKKISILLSYLGCNVFE